MFQRRLIILCKFALRCAQLSMCHEVFLQYWWGVWKFLKFNAQLNARKPLSKYYACLAPAITQTRQSEIQSGSQTQKHLIWGECDLNNWKMTSTQYSSGKTGSHLRTDLKHTWILCILITLLTPALKKTFQPCLTEHF